jgi:ABC-type branched-subunit amino acid transport system ATPase component/branched-subunit amino acid ABC-type transport system permease component
MRDYFPFLIIGISTGSIYGLTGTGLVVTYKTSGIFNFAHGSLGTLAVFAFAYLRSDLGVPWPVAGAISVLVLGPLLGVLLELLARALAEANHVIQIAATIGIVVAVVALGHLLYGSRADTFEPFLPRDTVEIFGVNVGWDRIILTAVALTLTIALYAFFRRARLGTAMRAVVDDPSLLAMTGEDPKRVRRWAWIIGASFAALSGILLAPGLRVDGIVLTLLVVQAFGAASVGMFNSLPLTYLGGVMIGVIGALSTKFVVETPSLSGLPPGLPFVVLFFVLIFTPRVRLARRRFTAPKPYPAAWHASDRVRVLAGVIAVAALCLVPVLVGTKLLVWSAALADVVLFVSLGMLLRTSGQVSLCHYAFAGVGAAAMAHLSAGAGVPWGLALLLAGLITVPIGAIVAIPAIRLSGVFLALATLGFGIFMEQMFFPMRFMFGPTNEGLAATRPQLDLGPIDLSTDEGYYFVILGCTVLAAVAMVALNRARLGRIMRAMADSPLALETLGVSVNVTRVLAFSISAFMAGIAGGLLASLYTFAVGGHYASFESLTIVALLAIIAVGAPWFALLAAFGHRVLPAYLSAGDASDYLNIFFGVSAALAVFTLRLYHGAPGAVRRFASRLDGWLGGASKPARGELPVGRPGIERTVRGGGLEIRDLRVAYGGVVAVDRLSLVAPSGVITGLIGPNGAGKTSAFNACCGLLRPAGGALTLHGADITDLSPSARARRGLGRTFQRVELFGSLTVSENVELGRESILAGGRPQTQLLGRRRDSDVVRFAAHEAIELTGLRALVDAQIAELSTGQKRLVELARVLAGPFDMVLLDEPSSGLDQRETERFGEILTRVVGEWGIGILLVEHDMSLVQQVCDHVYVLDFGQLIFDGIVDEMRRSVAVREAYLGEQPMQLVAGGAGR